MQASLSNIFYLTIFCSEYNIMNLGVALRGKTWNLYFCRATCGIIMTQSSSVHIFSNLSLSSEKCFGDCLQHSCVISLGCLGLRDCSPRKRASSASLMICDCPVWRAPCTGSAASHSVSQIQRVLHHHLRFPEDTMKAKQDCWRKETKTSECH